jgi:hypothetical protein
MIDGLGEKDGRTLKSFMICGHRSRVVTVVFAIALVVVLVIGIHSGNFTGHRDPDFKLFRQNGDE